MLALYTVNTAHQLKLYVKSKFDELLSSKEFAEASVQLRETPEHQLNQMVSRFLPRNFPTLILNAKKSRFWSAEMTDYLNRNTGRFTAFKDISLFPTPKFPGHEEILLSIRATYPGYVPKQTLSYSTLLIEVPVAGDHDFALELFNKMHLAGIFMDPEGRAQKLNLSASRGYNCLLRLEWPLPRRGDELTEEQTITLNGKIREFFFSLEHALKSAQKDFNESVGLQREETLALLTGNVDAERLRVQAIENRRTGYDKILNRLTDIS